MKNYFAIAMLIIGTIVGAGFASGRELVSFFGSSVSPFTAIPCAVLIFMLSAMFLYIGSKFNSPELSEANKKLGGRFHFITDAFLLVNNFIVLAGMLSAFDALGGMFFPMSPVYAIIGGVLCTVVVSKGIKGIIKTNRILVPITILSLITVCAITINSYGITESNAIGSIGTVIIYICMNMMLASTVLTTLNKLDKKTILISSAIAATLLGSLVFVLIMSLNTFPYPNSDLPVLEMARQISPIFFALIVVVIAISIFSTTLTAMSGLTAWFSSLFGSKIYTSIIVLLAGLTLANLGFSTVVTLLYPVIGVLGLVYTFLGIIFAFKCSALNRTRSKRLKHKFISYPAGTTDLSSQN